MEAVTALVQFSDELQPSIGAEMSGGRMLYHIRFKIVGIGPNRTTNPAPTVIWLSETSRREDYT